MKTKEKTNALGNLLEKEKIRARAPNMSDEDWAILDEFGEIVGIDDVSKLPVYRISKGVKDSLGLFEKVLDRYEQNF